MAMTRWVVHAATAVAMAVTAGAASAQEVVLKFSTFMAPQSHVWLDMHEGWMKKVEKESNGRIKFERYPAMQLGGTPGQLYDQVKDGVADVTWTLPGTTAGRFPRVEVFELPFMMSNAEATSKAYWEYVQTYAKDEFKDVHLLAVNVHGPGMFHTVNKPIKSIADLRGMKLRGPTRQVTKLLASLGATPVGMPLPGIPDALSKGVIDGAVIPWEVVPSVKVHELAKYHSEFDPSLPALYTTTFVMTMNKAKYESLPPDLSRRSRRQQRPRDLRLAWQGPAGQRPAGPRAGRGAQEPDPPFQQGRLRAVQEGVEQGRRSLGQGDGRQGLQGPGAAGRRQGVDREVLQVAAVWLIRRPGTVGPPIRPSAAPWTSQRASSRCWGAPS